MAGKLKFNLFDVGFNRLSDDVEVRLEHTVLQSAVYEVNKTVNGGKLIIDGIDTSQGGRYVAWVRPSHYREIVRIVRVVDPPETNEETIVFPIRPDRVKTVEFQDFAALTAEMRSVLNGSNVQSRLEAALSPGRQLAALRAIHELVMASSQFVIATHSPILLSYPNARIIRFSEPGVNEILYEDTEHYAVTRDFLNNYPRRLQQLLEKDEVE